MALNLPASAFTKLNEAILLFNRTCTVVYPEKRTDCPNCIVNTFGGRAVNTYKAGGPVPFNRGVECPYCGGEGFKNEETTESVELRIYYRKRYLLIILMKIHNHRHKMVVRKKFNLIQKFK